MKLGFGDLEIGGYLLPPGLEKALGGLSASGGGERDDG